MPKRREALLSSEEDSEGSCECSQPGASSAGGPQKKAAGAAGKMQTGGSQATELSRPKEGARKTASSHGDPLRSSPPYPGFPGLGFSVATSQNEETREAPLELQEGARSMASSVATRRLLWLRAWQTDWRSKAMVSECAFQGEKLFGEDLKEFLVDPKEKPKHLPKPSRNFDRKPSSNFNFRPQQGANQFKRDNFRRPYGNQGRHQNKKGFPYKKNPASDRYNQDNRQSKA
uniref:Uncharacterized protein n=1 Tax=Sphaerodactylus townsendi TaxID=933632 RepID=A0ACB8EY80_9SAUR